VTDLIRAEAGVIAALCARGYNEHIRIHGPDADHADATFETMAGSGFIVTCDGRRYVVLVAHESAVPLMTYEPRPGS
jgi:hypothetical protein